MTSMPGLPPPDLPNKSLLSGCATLLDDLDELIPERPHIGPGGACPSLPGLLRRRRIFSCLRLAFVIYLDATMKTHDGAGVSRRRERSNGELMSAVQSAVSIPELHLQFYEGDSQLADATVSPKGFDQGFETLVPCWNAG